MGVMPGDTPDYVLKNRTAWDGQADWYAKPGERNWASEEQVWGLWGIPEDDVGFFPDLEGRGPRRRMRDGIRLGVGRTARRAPDWP